MSLLATLLLICPLVAPFNGPFSVMLQAETTEPLGAYYAAIPVPPDLVVDDVVAALPFNAVWLVGDDGVLRVAGWQVTAAPTGDVPILTVQMHDTARGEVVLGITENMLFDNAGDQLVVTTQGCTIGVQSPQRVRAQTRKR